MKISILSTGSRGDLQPYIALGKALKDKGQQVQIATLLDFQEFVRSHGLDYFPVNARLSTLLHSDVVANAKKVDNPIKFFQSFRELGNIAGELQSDLFDACVGSDLIIYHPGAAVGYFAAQKMGIPAVLASPFPMTPTSVYPALIFYHFPSFGRAYNKFTHKIFEKIMWMASKNPLKKFWIDKFGKPPEDFSYPYGKQNSEKFPTIISCSQHVFANPKDWPDHIYNTGYWFLDEEPGWIPPPALINFLQQGSPPVYVGFGSVTDANLAKENINLVIEGLRMAGHRGVLSLGGQTEKYVAEDLFFLDDAPHSWLFPQMSVVIHHGGAGTTAAGFCAGVPSVIIPHSNDQFAWGKRVFELGVGSKPIPRKKLTSERLVAAIRYALQDEVRKAASNLGKKIQSENGTEQAAKIILDIIQ
jgi:sterol 3beta-glucosyltransferase